MENIELFQKAEDYLKIVKQKRDELHFIEEVLEWSSKRLKEKDDLRARFELESSIYYFENNFKSTQKNQSEITKIFEDDPDTLTLYLDKNWRAFEFDRIFKSTDFLYKLMLVGQKLKRKDIRIDKQMTREYVFSESRLYFYLASYEELQIKSIKFASPGFINFSGISEIVKEVKGFIKEILTFEYFRKIIDNFDYYRYKRPIEVHKDKSALKEAILKSEVEIITKKKEKLQAERELKLEKLKAKQTELEYKNQVNADQKKLEIQQLELERQEEIKKIEHEFKKLEFIQNSIDKLKQLSELIIELNNKGIVKGELLEQQIIQTISSIHSLGFEGNKLNLIPIGYDEKKTT